MTRVLDQLRTGRAQREEQAQYLQSVIAHIPVALMSVDEHGAVQLMNLAARRLFETACTDVSQLAQFGEAFATSLGSLKPGDGTIVRMERGDGVLQLKAAATGLVLGGVRHRLISLQNIETELTAQELAAWQTVIRVMAHEVMNSLTPISSLAATAGDIVTDVMAQLPPDDPQRAKLADAQEALETMARRSEGLLHFVQNHRRITKRMIVQIDVVPVRRIFARLQRLLAGELAARNIELTTQVVPETLEVSADIELLDQALINLLRNAMEALRDGQPGKISPDRRAGSRRPCGDRGGRQRPRHRARPAGKDFRALLHHQAAGKRRRPDTGAPDRHRAWRQRQHFPDAGRRRHHQPEILVSSA